MKISSKLFDPFKYLLILSISYVLGQGFIGYGVDYYALYYKLNNFTDRLDFIGLYIVSIYYSGFRIGIIFLAFVHIHSAYIFVKKFIPGNFIFFFLIIYSISWPAIFNILNVMRQGLLAAIILYGIIIYEKNRVVSYLLFLISGFIHRAGFIVLVVFIFVDLIIKIKLKKYFTILLFILSFMFYFLSKNMYGDIYTKTIGLNLNYIYCLISLFVIFLFYKRKLYIYYNFYDYFTVSCLTVFMALLAAGQNWQYERLVMLFILPILYFFSKYVRLKNINYFYFITMSLFSISIIRNVYVHFY